MDRDDQPTFFETPEALRAWIVVNHASADELWVGFHKKATGRPSITWPELVDELLDGALREAEDVLRIRLAERLNDELPGLIDNVLRDQAGGKPD